MTALAHQNTNACAIIFLSGKKKCVVIIILSKPVWGMKKELYKKQKALMPPPPPSPIAHSYIDRDQRAHCLTYINVEHLTIKNNTLEVNKKH